MSMASWFALGCMWLALSLIAAFIMTQRMHKRRHLPMFKSEQYHNKDTNKLETNCSYIQWLLFYWVIIFAAGVLVVNGLRFIRLFTELLSAIDEYLVSKPAG